jgi:hypothetical protein
LRWVNVISPFCISTAALLTRLPDPGGDGTSVPQITEIRFPDVASRAISAAASPASFTKEGFSTKSPVG